MSVFYAIITMEFTSAAVTYACRHDISAVVKLISLWILVHAYDKHMLGNDIKAQSVCHLFNDGRMYFLLLFCLLLAWYINSCQINIILFTTFVSRSIVGIAVCFYVGVTSSIKLAQKARQW